MIKWFDEYGLVRLYPYEIHKENAGLRTATYSALAMLSGEISQYRSSVNYVSALEALTDNEYGEIRSYPKTNNRNISHDDITGAICAIKIIGLHLPAFRNEFPIIHPQRFHPRDVAFYFACHYPGLKYLVLWITSIAMIISCAQTYKVRNGKKIIKTDGKILSLLRILALDMKWTYKICTYLLQKNKHFVSWANCFKIYYAHNDQHPIRRVTENIDQLLKDRFKE